MKRILIIKTSSLGDIIHALPAVTDAKRILGDVEFDWVVEESFADIPRMHPAVRNVIPVALRRWRKNYVAAWRSGEIKRFLHELRKVQYDAVIDAQALLKSALITRLARGKRFGLDYSAARESSAAWFYQHKVAAPRVKEAHAVVRMRTLFAHSLGYSVPGSPVDYGLSVAEQSLVSGNYVVFLHGTTWATKHWPELYWQQLAAKLSKAGIKVVLPWGNAIEQQRAHAIAAVCDGEVLPKLKVSLLASILQQAKAVVAVDTGLAHLSAALAVPTISLYGATDPSLTGTCGLKAINLSAQFICAPCLQRKCTYRGEHPVEPPCAQTLPPDLVWQQLQSVLTAYA